MTKPVLCIFFLGQDFAVQGVSMKTVQGVYFCFKARPANAKLATKKAKKWKYKYCHFSQRNYQNKLERLKFYPYFEDKWRRRTFSEQLILKVWKLFIKKLKHTVHFTIRKRELCNKQPANRACSNRPGEYWPTVLAVHNASKVHSSTTSGNIPQYSPPFRLLL